MTKNQFQKENARPSRIRIESIFPGSTENVYLLQRILGNLPRISRIQSHTVGNDTTDTRNDRQ